MVSRAGEEKLTHRYQTSNFWKHWHRIIVCSDSLQNNQLHMNSLFLFLPHCIFTVECNSLWRYEVSDETKLQQMSGKTHDALNVVFAAFVSGNSSRLMASTTTVLLILLAGLPQSGHYPLSSTQHKTTSYELRQQWSKTHFPYSGVLGPFCRLVLFKSVYNFFLL